MFPNGKKKALTFSFDDGVSQDRRFIKILNRYGLKGTFNLNSGILGAAARLRSCPVTVPHVRMVKEEIREVYAGHEIAAHTLTHPHLNTLSDEQIVREVEEDRLALSEIAGYEVVGFAYPYGDGAADERVSELVRSRTGVRYGRLTDPTYAFDLPADPIRWHASVHEHMEFEKMCELGREFLALAPETEQVFAVWGHSYELDMNDEWDAFEAFCAEMAGREDIWYATNREILLGE